MDPADFAAALLDAERPCPAGLRAWNGSDPARRLAVHRNTIIGSLVDALADTFPVTQALVGDEFFRAMAALFVRRHPPRTRVLAHYGDQLPAFVEGFAPARPVPCLADMARLEWARVQACHAADAAPVQADAVAAAVARGEAVADLRLLCHPSLAVVTSAHAVVSLWAAHQHEDLATLASVDADRPEAALVLRDGLDVLVLAQPPGAAAFVAALLHGERLAEAARQGLDAAAGAAASFDLAQTLAQLARHGAITRLHWPEGLPS